MAENAMSECDYQIEYHRMRDALLADIGKDTDEILTKLENKKGEGMDLSAFMAGQAAANSHHNYGNNAAMAALAGNQNNAAAIAALAGQNRGLGTDAALMLANQNSMGNMWNNPFMYLIWLAMFGYGGFGGFGGRGAPCGNGGDANAMLLQAINQGSNTAQRDIDRLAAAMGCGQSEIRGGLNVINSSLCQVANSVGMSVPQIVNAIQSGDASIISKMQECCCENRLAICQQTNTLSNGQAQLGFLIQNEGNATRQLMTTQNYENQIRAQQEKIDELRTSAQTSVLLNSNTTQTAAVNATLAAMSSVLAQILSKVSSTTTE